MKRYLHLAFMLPALALNVMSSSASPDSNKAGAPALRFANVEYQHRWSKADQHEFTPRDQPDLEHWSDMMTLNVYHQAKDGDALASIANAVLTNYQNNKAMVLRTDSLPRTQDKPAEHLIVVLFPRPEFIEAVFARFKLAGDTGVAVIYSHREYGNKVGNQMSAWLQKNGPVTEKALMSWNQLPNLASLKN